MEPLNESVDTDRETIRARRKPNVGRLAGHKPAVAIA